MLEAARWSLPKSYKDSKDIGTQRQASTRVQQPTQARGSADALSAKEAQRKAIERERQENQEQRHKQRHNYSPRRKNQQCHPTTNPPKHQGIQEMNAARLREQDKDWSVIFSKEKINPQVITNHNIL